MYVVLAKKGNENYFETAIKLDSNNINAYEYLAFTYGQQYSIDNDFWDRKPTKAELEKCKREKEVAIKNYNLLIEKIREKKDKIKKKSDFAKG